MQELPTRIEFETYLGLRGRVALESLKSAWTDRVAAALNVGCGGVASRFSGRGLEFRAVFGLESGSRIYSTDILHIGEHSVPLVNIADALIFSQPLPWSDIIDTFDNDNQSIERWIRLSTKVSPDATHRLLFERATKEKRAILIFLASAVLSVLISRREQHI